MSGDPQNDNAAKVVSIATDAVPEMTCQACGAVNPVRGLEPFSKVNCTACGAEQTVPAQLGPFRLLRLIGMGGMGGVFHAKDETLGRYVAIKVMLKSLGDDRDFVQTFKHEAQAVAKLNHPHIAQIYSFGQEKGQPYIVMELVSGERLDTMIEEGRELSEAFVMKVALEIAEGLAMADEAGLVHGDIKPENILLDEKGNSKLVDFGLATSTHQAQADGIWGTPYYIAPEKVRRQKVDARSDIYSLGATVFHALTGRPPFEGETPVDVVKARLDAEAPKVSDLRPGTDPEVDRIVARMLEEDSTRRYPTYASLLGDLRKVLPTLQSKDKSKTASPRKVMIRKKGAKPGLSTSTGNIPGGDSKPGGSKPSRLVVPKKRFSIPAAPDKAKASAPGEETAEEKPAPKPGGGRLVGVILLILLIIGLIAGGTVLGLRHKARREAEQAAQRALAALETARRQAGERFEAVTALWETLQKRGDTAMEHYRRAADNVRTVCGRDLPPPAPPRSEPEPAPEAAPAAEQPAAEQPAAEQPAAEQPAAPEPAEAPAEAPAPAPEPEPVPLIYSVAERAVENAAEIAGLVASGRLVHQQAVEARDAALEAVSAEALSTQADSIENAVVELGRLDRRAAEIQQRMADTVDKTTALRTQHEEEARRQAEAEAEAARLRAAEEEARRDAAQRQARIDAERQRAQAAEQSVRSLVSQNLFADAAADLRRQDRDFETPEGRRAMAMTIERYVLLEEMKQLFVDRLAEAPYSWGWVQGAQAEDILGANSRTLKLRTRNVPWTEVGTRQMLQFIRQYIDERRSATRIRLRELARYNAAAAIFCHLNGGDEFARRYAEKAADLLPTMQQDIRDLLPALFAEPAGDAAP